MPDATAATSVEPGRQPAADYRPGFPLLIAAGRTGALTSPLDALNAAFSLKGYMLMTHISMAISAATVGAAVAAASLAMMPAGVASRTTTPSTAPVAATAQSASATCHIAVSAANLRSKPTTSSSIVGVAYRGWACTPLSVTIPADGLSWEKVRITRTGVTGWVREDLLGK